MAASRLTMRHCQVNQPLFDLRKQRCFSHGLRNELKDILICAQWRVRSKLLIERDIF